MFTLFRRLPTFLKGGMRHLHQKKVTITETLSVAGMRIEDVNLYHVMLPLKDGKYSFSQGRSFSSIDCTVVEIVTDTGVKGYGEVCPVGSNFIPAYSKGVRSGLATLVPKLMGENPLELERLNCLMDYHLKGHNYVKSGVDMACWDILGKVTGLPLYTLLGGRYGKDFELTCTIPNLPANLMVQRVHHFKQMGYRKFQLKLSGKLHRDIQTIKHGRSTLDPEDTLIADANGSLLPHEAIRAANALSHLDVYLEQPCETYEQCLVVRKHTNSSMILDEPLDSVGMLIRMAHDNAADVISLKISKVGGITKAKQMRDLCISLGIALTIEDAWGSEITTAATAHLMHSTPEKHRFGSTDLCNYNLVKTAEGVPPQIQGRMAASDKPGLGITPIPEILGKPILYISSS